MKELYTSEMIQLKRLLAVRIRTELEKQNRSIHQLAFDLRVSSATLYRYLDQEKFSPKKSPSVEYLLKILIAVSPKFDAHLSGSNQIFTTTIQ